MGRASARRVEAIPELSGRVSELLGPDRAVVRKVSRSPVDSGNRRGEDDVRIRWTAEERDPGHHRAHRGSAETVALVHDSRTPDDARVRVQHGRNRAARSGVRRRCPCLHDLEQSNVGVPRGKAAQKLGNLLDGRNSRLGTPHDQKHVAPGGDSVGVVAGP